MDVSEDEMEKEIETPENGKKGVDLRSSKVCEPRFLNYKAKQCVFNPYNRSKFRCRYDYYWASVF
ncbi:hypothetical protein NC651_023406 [Populus alba x Populus x berolinensis]|nr:hypothetical protein NC651_023406 [Populus alba x Populus x berolinensis]